MTKIEKVPVLRDRKVRSRGNRRLLTVLLIFFIILFVVLFFNSSLSKISNIVIQGNHFVPTSQIEQMSQVSIGDQFLLVSPSTIVERLKQIPALQDIEVHKRFPGLLTIQVKEYDHIANESAANGEWHAVLANGTVMAWNLAYANGEQQMDKPILSGWADQEELRSLLCEALLQVRTDVMQDISEIIPDPTEAYEDRILIYTRSGFEVTTAISKMVDKLPYLPGVINDMYEKGYEGGQITMLEAITSEPFSKQVDETEKRDY